MLATFVKRDAISRDLGKSSEDGEIGTHTAEVAVMQSNSQRGFLS